MSMTVLIKISSYTCFILCCIMFKNRKQTKIFPTRYDFSYLIAFLL